MKSLIVVDDDDDAVTLIMIKGFLSPYGECDTAINGGEALESFNRALDADNALNLIYLDISMPDMDGHEVLSAIRKIEDSRKIPSKEKVKVFMSSAGSTKKNLMKAFIGQ